MSNRAAVNKRLSGTNNVPAHLPRLSGASPTTTPSGTPAIGSRSSTSSPSIGMMMTSHPPPTMPPAGPNSSTHSARRLAELPTGRVSPRVSLTGGLTIGMAGQSPKVVSPLTPSATLLPLPALPPPVISPPNGSAAASNSSGSSVGPSAGGSKDNIQVVVRIRPGADATDMSLYQWQLSADHTRLVDASSDGGATSAAAPYLFDQVYPPQSTTEDIYTQSISETVARFCAGFNSTLFAYGQTNSGKTHTMMGDSAQPGLTLLAIRQIFSIIAQDTQSVYLLRCAFMEIYNESCNDLLNANAKTSKDLPIREVQSGFKVANLTETICTSMAEVLRCIEVGNANRKVGVSNLNEHSSRSHSIFRLTLESAIKIDTASSNHGGGGGPASSTSPGGGASGGGPSTKLSGAVKVSELNLVDLAGSETLSYEFGHAQQKETKNINLSLTQLKSVIAALSKSDSFVPYRNSSLTKILKQSLGGNARTTLIVAMNPLGAHVRVSRASLQFGQLARTIQNRARVNETVDDTGVLLKQQQQKIANLEGKLAGMGRLEEEKERIQREYAQLQRHLSELQAKEREQVELQRQMNEETSKVVVGGGVASSDTYNFLVGGVTVSTVSEEELQALSNQLSTLQSQKSELEAAKATLEARLLAQVAHAAEVEAEINGKQNELARVALAAEGHQAELQQMARVLKEREEEEAHMQSMLIQQMAASAEKERRAGELADQLRVASEASAEKERQAATLADELRAAVEASAEKERAAGELAAELARSLAASAEKERVQQAELTRQAQEMARREEKERVQQAELARQTQELAKREAEQQAQLAGFAAQLRSLEETKLKQTRDQGDLVRKMQSEQQEADALLKKLQAEQHTRNATQAALLAKLKAEQLEKERALQARVEEMERLAAAGQAEQEALLAKLRAEQLDRERALQARVDSERSAAAEKWRMHEMLAKASGMDKDSYLAALIEKFENDNDDLKARLSDAESIALANRLQAEEEMTKVKRQLAAAQASIANGAGATSPTAGGGSASFPQPDGGPSGASSSSSSSSSGGSLSHLPLLVLPGVIDAAEAARLLNTAPPPTSSLCPTCGSADRVRAEKLRSLANHARRSLDSYASQLAQVDALKETVELQKMQLKEFAGRR